MRISFVGFLAASLLLTEGALAADKSEADKTPRWNHSAAAQYLDSREVWWQSWPAAQRDHGTTCVSCHTVLPYALARPALRADLHEQPSHAERTMLANVEKRVSLWSEMDPFYQDTKDGPNKSVESRATEAVITALILASHDAQSGVLREVTNIAFDHAWALQLKDSEDAGAWNWQVFHLAPWESGESQYQGAAFMALAAGLAPGSYLALPKIQGNLQALSSYLARHSGLQPLLNRIVMLWASARLPGLLTAPERASLLKEIAAVQQPDGGWSLSSLGSWQRHDHTALPGGSDGYATGLVLLALEDGGVNNPSCRRGVAWLIQHQDPAAGAWHATSLNKQRDPTSDIGRFMNDAATGYAVLALEKSH